MSRRNGSKMCFILVSQSKPVWVGFYQKEHQCQQEEWQYLFKCGSAEKNLKK